MKSCGGSYDGRAVPFAGRCPGRGAPPLSAAPLPDRLRPLGDEHERYTAALSYVWILCLYTLLFKKRSAFIQFHAKQGLILFVIELLSFVFFVFAPLVIILCVVMALLGIRAALAGKSWPMPVVSDIVKKLGL